MFAMAAHRILVESGLVAAALIDAPVALEVLVEVIETLLESEFRRGRHRTDEGSRPGTAAPKQLRDRLVLLVKHRQSLVQQESHAVVIGIQSREHRGMRGVRD